MIDNHAFGKNQKLKSRKAIEQLFLEGKSIFSYPIKCIYSFVPYHGTELQLPKVATVAPKRRVRKAVNRNKVKRRIKEAYRLNNHQLLAHSVEGKTLNLAFIYVGNDIEPYAKIEKSIQYILRKLIT